MAGRVTPHPRTVKEGRRVHIVQQHRVERGWSPEELARRVGCSPKRIQAIEEGRAAPSLKLVHDLAAAFGVAEADLLVAYADEAGP